MADQGLWFKLWCAALDDPDLDNLSVADFGRWAKLGAYIKRHGQAGVLSIQSPARALCAMLQLDDFAAFHVLISRLPNVREEMQKCNGGGVTIATVTYVNWVKYQGDFSRERVRRFREMKRSKRRGEETRREETRRDERKPTTLSGLPPDGAQQNGQARPLNGAREVLAFLNHKAGRNYQPSQVNLDLIRARLAEGSTVAQCRAIIGRKTAAWKGDEKMASFLRPATLFNRTKFAQYLGELPSTAFQEDPDA